MNTFESLHEAALTSKSKSKEKYHNFTKHVSLFTALKTSVLRRSVFLMVSIMTFDDFQLNNLKVSFGNVLT